MVACGGIEHGGFQFPLFDKVQAQSVSVKCIHPDDARLQSVLLHHLVHGSRHGVVVGKDEVRFLSFFQQLSCCLCRLVCFPASVGGCQQAKLRMQFHLLGKSAGAFRRRCAACQPRDLPDDAAFRVFGCQALGSFSSDLEIVGSHIGCNVRRVDLPIHDNDRNAGTPCPFHGGADCVCFVRCEDDEVHAFTDEAVDLSHLQLTVVVGVSEVKFHVVSCGCHGLHFAVHLFPPGVVTALRHANAQSGILFAAAGRQQTAEAKCQPKK